MGHFASVTIAMVIFLKTFIIVLYSMGIQAFQALRATIIDQILPLFLTNYYNIYTVFLRK